MLGKALGMAAKGAIAGVKAAKAGGDARAVTKASIHGAGVPQVGGAVDKAVDWGFNNAPMAMDVAKRQAPVIADRAKGMAQGISDKLRDGTTPKPLDW
jgi:hypothetical protein